MEGIWKCIAYPGFVANDPHADYTVGRNRELFASSGTQLARIVADWPTCQPAPGQFNWGYIAQLDSQIAAIKADGRAVALTAYRFPQWANGTLGLDESGGPAYQESLYDRQAEGNTNPKKIKERELKPPGAVTVNSPWGQWIGFLALRYNYYNPNHPPGAWVDFLEICNEPNGQMWPIMFSSGSYAPAGMSIHCTIGTMFQTAQAYTSYYGGQPRLIGPASADTVDLNANDRRFVNARDFTSGLISWLNNAGFQPLPTFTWTHHNYSDIVYARWSSPSTNAAQQVRAQLWGRWAGYGGLAGAIISITEGGAPKQKLEEAYNHRNPWPDPTLWQSYEALQMQQAANQLRHNTPCGAGISLFSQYLTYPDADFDSALLNGDGSNRSVKAVWDAA
jgi:hypothetical protein